MRSGRRAVDQHVLQEWEKINRAHPNISLDFTGELDDIQESIDSIMVLFLLGVGLMYAILGYQFKSYFQSLMILATVPMAFTGVVLELLITQNPLGLFTMYGVVALAGISVNAAIVLISAAISRLPAGMPVLHATLYAAHRRVVPILITSLKRIAGLFSLASVFRRPVFAVEARGHRRSMRLNRLHGSYAVRHPPIVPVVYGNPTKKTTETCANNRYLIVSGVFQ